MYFRDVFKGFWVKKKARYDDSKAGFIFLEDLLFSSFYLSSD